MVDLGTGVHCAQCTVLIQCGN